MVGSILALLLFQAIKALDVAGTELPSPNAVSKECWLVVKFWLRSLGDSTGHDYFIYFIYFIYSI